MLCKSPCLLFKKTLCFYTSYRVKAFGFRPGAPSARAGEIFRPCRELPSHTSSPQGKWKILCAVDLSEHSKAVAEYAVLLAKGLGASVLVVYTAPSLSQYVGFHVPPNTIENFVGEIVTGAEKSMEAFVAENFAGVEAKGQVLIGYAAEEILNRAHEEKVDIIVMGTHGRKGIDRILFGSVAEKVVKNADMPVLTIRPTEPIGE